MCIPERVSACRSKMGETMTTFEIKDGFILYGAHIK